MFQTPGSRATPNRPQIMHLQAQVAALQANQSVDNFLPNVNWQLWSGLTSISKENSAGTGSIAPIAFTDPGTQTASPVLTVASGTTSPLAVNDICTLSRVIGGAANYWGYPGTAYANATAIGARITAVSSTQITLLAPLNAVSPSSAASWNVQAIGIGDRSGSGQGPDGWSKSTTLNIWADDYAANAAPGAVRVLGMSKGITGDEVFYWNCAPNQLNRFRGKTVTFGALVWQKVQAGSGTWQLFIHDDSTTQVNSVAGSGTGYQFLSVTTTISNACTGLQIGLLTHGNSGNVYYMALPTAVIGSSSLTAAACKQNTYDYIPATAHWNPPILLGYQFNFPSTDTPPGSGLYGINGIDIEAISLCQCHKSVAALVTKVEWKTSTVGSYIFSGNNLNAGGAGPTTQSLKFGPQTITCVSSVNNVGQGQLPLWYDGTFTLFTNSSGGFVPTSNTWDFWDVIGSVATSLA